MLYGYPIEATVENWFHESLLLILRNTNNALLNHEPLPSWLDKFPEPYREKINGRGAFEERLEAYRRSAATLTRDELNQVSEALTEQNNISGLLANTSACATLPVLPQTLRAPILELYDFGFKLLSRLEIRDRQYKIIYDSMPTHVCPFCGCEYFDAPGAPRGDLDHYLAESKYTFAAVNLCNLVPMGSKCNERYKLAQDIIFREDGSRRRAFYPYEARKVRISLEGSIPFMGKNGLFPDWQMEFIPSSEEISTWDEVFHIQERYKRDILDQDFMSWLREFSSWCCSANIRHVTDHDILDALKRYSDNMETMNLRDRAFLKAAMFKMLHHLCEQGNQRLFDLIKGVVIGGMA